MIFDKNLEDILQNYDNLLFDVWGVIHDGTSAYPNAVSVVKNLRENNKNIAFISNAPRRADKVKKVLENYGIKEDYYNFILTSGELAFMNLNENQKRSYDKFGKNYLYIGPDKDLDLLDGLDYNMVEKAEDADFALTTGFNDYNSTIEEKISQIKDAISHNLHLICVNPDKIVVKKNGDEMLCAGVIAEKYQDLGGNVTFYGKPYEEIYKKSHELFGNNIDKKSIIAIGDGLETDIKGANNYKIKSLLLTSGILSNKLNVKFGENADQSKVKEQCDINKSYPDYILPNL